MRKLLYFLYLLVLVLPINACSQRNIDNNSQYQISIAIGKTQAYLNEPKVIAYRDGTYTAQGDMANEGNQVATVSIKNGIIDGVTLYSINRNGDNFSATGNIQAEKTNNPTNIRGTSVNNPAGGTAHGSRLLSSTQSSSNDVRKKLAESIIQNQRYDVNVDNDNPQMINNWKLAVKRALAQAAK